LVPAELVVNPKKKVVLVSIHILALLLLLQVEVEVVRLLMLVVLVVQVVADRESLDIRQEVEINSHQVRQIIPQLHQDKEMMEELETLLLVIALVEAVVVLVERDKMLATTLPVMEE
jgi:uncharacterized membrane protein